ncbi:hypothetical protein predicted by Glimmer/Critica [Helicobacter pylori B8]|uniref:Uncharacterized protein n=1 Tax=Helicobacter pylori (strain B8) TaxID=693745 RepID=D7FCV5_HELP3|nr:hypothetical protein predicted by Glimmer/Critica [Helicobacter pylori B8]
MLLVTFSNRSIKVCNNDPYILFLKSYNTTLIKEKP